MLSHLPHVTTFLTLFLKTMQALIELQQSQAVRNPDSGSTNGYFYLAIHYFHNPSNFFRFVELP